MIQIAFKMKLKPGCAEEYKKRHDEIWPELVDLHSEAGIFDYAIYVDAETDTLFAVQKRIDHHRVDELPQEPLLRKWWAFMQDLMECHADGSPIVQPLEQVFYMD